MHLQWRRPGFDPWVGKIPWGRKWLPTPAFWPGWFHGQRSLMSMCMGLQRVTWPSNKHFQFHVSCNNIYLTKTILTVNLKFTLSWESCILSDHSITVPILTSVSSWIEHQLSPEASFHKQERLKTQLWTISPSLQSHWTNVGHAFLPGLLIFTGRIIVINWLRVTTWDGRASGDTH